MRPVVAAALLFVGAAIVLALSPTSMRAAFAQARRLPAWAPAAAFALVLLQLAFQGLRLWALAPRRLALRVREVLPDWAAGEWLNTFAPARGGDAMKVVLLRRRRSADGAALPAITGAMLADKVVDGVSILLLCAAGGLLGLLWRRAATEWRLLAGLVAVAAACFVVLRIAAAAHWPRARAWLADAAAGFAALRDPAQAAASLLSALLAWAAEGVALWLLCLGLGITLTAPQVLLALVALNVAIGIPIALANLGVYEAALAAGLAQAGVPLPAAIAVAVVHHAIQLGALTAFAASLSYRTLTARA